MPNPVKGDIHVNRPLTQISIAYMQDVSGFVADRVFPNIPVNNQTDLFFKYDRADFWRDQYKKRAPGTQSAGSGWKIDTDNYRADVWALHKDVSDQLRGNEDSPLSFDRDSTLWLGEQAMISREVNWAAAFFTTSIWTGIDGTLGDITGVPGTPSTNEVVQWNDADSTPIEDVTEQATNIQRRTGKRPQKLVIGREVWDQLKNHPDIVDRIKFSGGVSNTVPANVSKEAVAILMELDEVMVMEGIQATSDENEDFEGSLVTAFIAGKRALLVYAAPAASILTPSGGYTFSWTGFLSAGNMGNRIKKFRMEPEESDRIEGQMAYDQKLVSGDLGVFFNDIVA